MDRCPAITFITGTVIAKPAPVDRWRDTRDAIYRDVYTNFWDEKQQTFVGIRGTDVIVTGSRISPLSAPPPPPPAPERDGGIVAPGQLETGVSLNLLYRMER